MKQALCAAGLAALCLTWAASAAAQPTPDHLKCYKVKDPQAKAAYTADLGGLVAEHGCKIKVPAKLECVTTSATNVSPTPPGRGGSGRPNSFTCYKVRCPPATVPTLTASDQFGTRTVTVGAAQLLCAPNAGPTDGGFPATGQTTCWDTGGNLIPCAGTGEDGNLRKGAPLSYSDNGDGTITDNNTGLVWEKHSRDGSIHDVTNGYTWDEAFSVHMATLNAMNFAGHSDWRVPSANGFGNASPSTNELGTILLALYPYCRRNPCIDAVFGPTYGAYWSASTWGGFLGDYAWWVEFEYGTEHGSKKFQRLFVRAVR